jgi:hypothetical protein
MKNILCQSFLCFASEDSNPVLQEEKRKIKKYALTRAAFDLVAICLVFFSSSSFSYSYTTANKIFSLDGVTQKKGKRVITNPLLSFTFCVLVSSLILFSFPIFL